MANLLAEYEARPGRAMKLFSSDVFVSGIASVFQDEC